MAEAMDWNFDDVPPTDEQRRAENALNEEKKGFHQNASDYEMDLERDKSTESVFSRFKTDWSGEDRDTISGIMEQADVTIKREFREAYDLLWDIYLRIRELELRTDEETGEVEPVFDSVTGEPVWKKDVNGKIIEDWVSITEKEREEYILRITLFLIELQQRSADLWGESMMAKARWEETFTTGFLAAKGTNDARTNEGKARARADRYFALYRAWISRKADTLVKSFELLGQRLKDTNF